MKRLFSLLPILFLISLPLAAAELPQVAQPASVTPVVEQQTSPAAALPILGIPQPLNASSCRAVAMTSCDNGSWMVCEGNVQCDFGWKWVYCDGQASVCPECSWGASCL
jgi:hypothetical protein